MSRGKSGLLYDVGTILKHNRHAGGQTQSHCSHTLKDFIDTIWPKYKIRRLSGIRRTHVDYYIENLKARGHVLKTIKSKLSALRWFTRIIERPTVVRKNREYDLPKSGPQTNKAWPEGQFEKICGRIKHPGILHAMHAARYLGLRSEEAGMVRPSDINWKLERVTLRRGPKGGRFRYVQLRKPQAKKWARDLEIRAFGMDKGIIPPTKKLKSWQNDVCKAIAGAGGGRVHALTFHGLRHTFAQEIYREMTGHEPPIAGGGASRETHIRACKVIAKKLGHNRWAITEEYVGRLAG